MSTMPESLTHTRSRDVWTYWQSLNDGRMPAAALWDPISVPKAMPWCTIVERGGPTGFQHRFAGTAICDFYGEEMTGQAVGSRMSEAARPFYFANIEVSLTRPCARIIVVEARSKTGRNCLFETLSLPLADASGKGFRLLNHQATLEELPYGEAQTNFALPAFAHWIDIGAGVPEEL
ncbi:MAG: PAS domain-containing protein [Parvibaculum sp.]